MSGTAHIHPYIRGLHSSPCGICWNWNVQYGAFTGMIGTCVEMSEAGSSKASLYFYTRWSQEESDFLHDGWLSSEQGFQEVGSRGCQFLKPGLGNWPILILVLESQTPPNSMGQDIDPSSQWEENLWQSLDYQRLPNHTWELLRLVKYLEPSL